MIETVVLARLGDTVDEVVILEWCVEPGDRVEVGQTLMRVETDKVDVDVESPYQGTVVERLVAEHDEVATGSVLCRIEI